MRHIKWKIEVKPFTRQVIFQNIKYPTKIQVCCLAMVCLANEIQQAQLQLSKQTI